MSTYDIWKESGPVDALTAAELAESGEDCPYCGHWHGQREVEGDEVRPYVPAHSDHCDCDGTDDGPNPDDQRDAEREKEWDRE